MSILALIQIELLTGSSQSSSLIIEPAAPPTPLPSSPPLPKEGRDFMATKNVLTLNVLSIKVSR
ncbi:hypothetical protein M0804_014477 [Polistes exclamans]|nr:hypothetical protein M0804_014479 [Polistes exclamans]KAI4475163.1 hypothetical protein M0804_014477 [Polistes exclamans]